MKCRQLKLLKYWSEERSGSQPRAQGFERLHAIADDLQGSKDGNCQKQAGSSPDPSPKQKRQAYRERIELQARSNDARIDEVHGHQVDADHGHNHRDESALVQRSESTGERRNQREENAKVGNQGDETTDKADEVKVLNVEIPEHDPADK